MRLVFKISFNRQSIKIDPGTNYDLVLLYVQNQGNSKREIIGDRWGLRHHSVRDASRINE